MAYYKIVEDDYIVGIGTGRGGEQISGTEYEEIMTAMRNKPLCVGVEDYRLRTDLTWEKYGDEGSPDDEPTDEEYAIAGRILLGGII